MFSRGQQQPAIKWVTDEAIEVPSRGFGIYPVARSPDGSYTIAWDDGGEVSGRYVGGFRESGLGCYLLAFRDQVIVEGKLERPNAGKVSNVGTFILNDSLFGRDSNGVFHVFSRDGKSMLSHRFEADLICNAMSKDGRFAVCQLFSSPHEDGGTLVLFELDRGILLWQKRPERQGIDSFDFDTVNGALQVHHTLLGWRSYSLSKEEVHYSPGDPIPEWDQPYASLKNASPIQKSFYTYWKDHFERNLAVDVGNNHSYLFAYVYEQLALFVRSKKIQHLHSRFERIATEYPSSKVVFYLDGWFRGALLYNGQFDEAWEIQRDGKWNDRGMGIRYEDFLNTKCLLASKPLEGTDLLAWIGYKCDLTTFGKGIDDVIQSQATRRLREFELVHGESLVDHFLADWDWDCVTAESLDRFKGYYDSSSEWEKQIKRDMNGIQHRRSWSSSRSVFGSVPNVEAKITFRLLPSTVVQALTLHVRQFLRECENDIREDRGIPRIGEGWVSETQLYWEVKGLFPDLKVIHHGRPPWLGRQHLDIFIPEVQLAIEYQGKQHYEAVEFFGGVDALERREELDRQKKKKCDDNAIALIIVDATYDWEQLSKQLVNNVQTRLSSLAGS